MKISRPMRGLIASALLLGAAQSMAADPIRIGVPVGLSGANSVVAPSVVQSSQLAVDEINAKGGILGRKVEFVVYDDTFTAFKKNVRELCGLLMERRDRLSWSCFSIYRFPHDRTGSSCSWNFCFHYLPG